MDYPSQSNDSQSTDERYLVCLSEHEASQNPSEYIATCVHWQHNKRLRVHLNQVVFVPRRVPHQRVRVFLSIRKTQQSRKPEGSTPLDYKCDQRAAAYSLDPRSVHHCHDLLRIRQTHGNGILRQCAPARVA